VQHPTSLRPVQLGQGRNVALAGEPQPRLNRHVGSQPSLALLVRAEILAGQPTP
jgi:hypothetical protein